MKKLVLLSIAIVFMCGCSGKFSEKGYFKDEVKNRVFTVITKTTDSLDMLKYGHSKMNTDRRLTKVYFYTDEANAQDISGSSNLEHAIARGCNEHCVAVYSKFPTGREELIMSPDCGGE